MRTFYSNCMIYALWLWLRLVIDWAAAAAGDKNHCENAYLQEMKKCLKKTRPHTAS